MFIFFFMSLCPCPHFFTNIVSCIDINIRDQIHIHVYASLDSGLNKFHSKPLSRIRSNKLLT